MIHQVLPILSTETQLTLACIYTAVVLRSSAFLKLPNRRQLKIRFIIGPYCPQWGMGLQQCLFSTGSCLKQLTVPLPMTNPSHLVQFRLSFSRWFWVFPFFFCLQVSTQGQPWVFSLTTFVTHVPAKNKVTWVKFGSKLNPIDHSCILSTMHQRLVVEYC